MNIITGEKIQNFCDYYIGLFEDFKFNPYIRNQHIKQIILDDNSISIIKKLTIKNIFCYTHILYNNFNKLFILLNNINCKFNIIFHNSDGNFEEKYLKLLEIKNLNKIFTQNINVKPSDKVIPIPIGIANSMWKHGSLDIWNKILNEVDLNLKENFIYFNFNINTNVKNRKKCYDIIISKNIENIENKDYYNYLKCLSSYKFAICPEGNGIDTHRFHECLYLKTIPICLHNHVTYYYSKLYPVVLLDKWEDLNILVLKKFYELTNWNNYNLLSFNNLKNLLINF